MSRAAFWHGFGCGLAFLALLLAAIYRDTATWLAVSVVWAIVAGLAYMIDTAEDEPDNPWDFGA